MQPQKLKDSSFVRTPNVPSARSKAKSSQGYYPEFESKKNSIDVAPLLYDRTGSMSGWAEGGLLL